MAKAVSDPWGKQVLHKLSEIEKGHAALLEEEYEFIRRSKPMFPPTPLHTVYLRLILNNGVPTWSSQDSLLICKRRSLSQARKAVNPCHAHGSK